MFLKIAKNSSENISVKVVIGTSGKEMKTIADKGKEQLIHELVFNGKHELDRLNKRHIAPDAGKDCLIEQSLVAMGRNSGGKTRPEIIFGRIYNNLGFNVLKEFLFRHFVIASFASPGKKFDPTEYFYRFHGVFLDKNEINFFLERLNAG